VGTFTSTNSNYASGGTAGSTLVINSATPALTVTCNSATFNNSAQTCSPGGSATGVAGASVTGTWTYTYNGSSTAPTNAASYPVVGTFTSTNTNYASGGTAGGTLNIDAIAPSLTLTCTEVPYDGNAHACTGSATGLSGATVAGSFSFSPASETNAGSYPVTGTFTSTNTNYTSGGTAGGTLQIDAIAPALALTCTEVPYDGNAHACTGSATGLSGATVAGSFSLSPASETNAGSYPVTGTFTSTNTNYTSGGTAGGTLQIDAIAPSLTLICTEVPYDGNAHACTGSATGVGGATVAGSFSLSPASETNAGSYPVTGAFTSTNTNYISGGTAGGTLQIDAIAPSLTLICTEVPYDGNAHACTSSATGLGGATVAGSFSLSPASETNAGSYPVTGAFTSANTNYTSGTAGGTLKIDAIAPALALTCTEVPYDDSAHACTGSATGLGGATVAGSFSLSPASETNAGSYPVTGAFTSANSNYTSGGTAGGTLKIDAIAPTLTLSCGAVTYSGSAQTCANPGGAATGLGGAAVTGTWAYTYNGSPAAPTNIGSYPVVGTFTSANTNYTSGGTASGTLAIGKATPALSVICGAVTYTGSPQTCTNPGGVAAGAGGVAVSGAWAYTYNGSSTAPTNPGSYPVVGTFTTADTNYVSGGTAGGTLVIATATPAVTVKCTSIVYDGNTHSCTAAATGIGGATVSGNITLTYNGSATAPSAGGTYTVVATLASTNPDYGTGSGTGSLTIAPATPTLTVTCATVSYTGSPQGCANPGGTATGLPSLGGATVSGTWAYTYNGSATAPTAPGSYTVAGTFNSSDSNYASGGMVTGASFTINAPVAAPVPAITNLSPFHVIAGAAATTLTVTGSNFESSAVVEWGGAALTTTFVSSTQLTATIPATDLSSVTTAGITVFNPAPVSGALSETSAAFVFAVDTLTSTTAPVTVTTSTSQVTVQPGASVPVPVSVAGASSTATTTATCVNLPAGATCSYSNGNVVVTAGANTPPGTYNITIIVTITQMTASLLHSRAFFAAWSGIMGLPLGLLWMGGGRKKTLRRVFLALMGMLLLLSLAGCGGNGQPPASSAVTQQSLQVALNVQ
jgi:hypothetical protein